MQSLPFRVLSIREQMQQSKLMFWFSPREIKISRQELGFLAVTIALFSFLGAGNEARIDAEDDDNDVVEHDDDNYNNDEKNDYDYNEKHEL